ncbi:hypothetical protein KIPB_016617, partial [Kipferlia bialata]
VREARDTVVCDLQAEIDARYICSISYIV